MRRYIASLLLNACYDDESRYIRYMRNFNDTQVIIMTGGVGKDIRLYECKNCVVHAADESKVVVQGLDGYIVAEKNGHLLVCSLKEEQRIKEFDKLKINSNK